MANVLGVGGIFFKSSDPDALRAWYRQNLGIEAESWGGTAFLFDRRDKSGVGCTVWTPFKSDSKHFDPSTRPFMVNLRVDDLEAALTRLRAGGAQVVEGRREDAENGKFGYVVDPDGTLIELWEQSDPDPYMPATVADTERANKKLVVDFFACFADGDVDRALGYLADDATWWIIGDPKVIPTSGELDKPRLGRLFRRMLDAMTGGMRFTIESAIAEGDRLAVEMTGHAELKNGRIYANRYHLAMTVRDGKIQKVREYLDTQHVIATWFTP